MWVLLKPQLQMLLYLLWKTAQNYMTVLRKNWTGIACLIRLADAHCVRVKRSFGNKNALVFPGFIFSPLLFLVFTPNLIRPWKAQGAAQGTSRKRDTCAPEGGAAQPQRREVAVPSHAHFSGRTRETLTEVKSGVRDQGRLSGRNIRTLRKLIATVRFQLARLPTSFMIAAGDQKTHP